MYRRGDDRLAYQAARMLLDQTPGHVGGMMLLLASAGGCGDELTISTALLGVAKHYGRLLAVPEVLEMFDSDLMAPVVGSHTFRAVFAPALRAAQRQTCDASDRELARLVQEALRDASVESVLLAAPVLGEPPVEEGGEGLCLVDVDGELVAALQCGRAYVGGRANDVDIHLAHVSVSRHHFLLEHRRGAWVVKNLSATNRTQVNGRPVDDGWTRLLEGDELRAGKVPLDFVPAESVFPKARTAGVRAERYVPGSCSRTRSMERALPVSSSMSTTTPCR